MNYERKSNWTFGENKPNSNPIKPNFQKAQMNVNLTLTRDYREKDDFAVQKNKPNSNPISVKPKMSANVFVTKDYENETAFGLRESKPKQSQFQIGRQTTEGRVRPSRLRRRPLPRRVGPGSAVRRPADREAGSPRNDKNRASSIQNRIKPKTCKRRLCKCLPCI